VRVDACRYFDPQAVTYLKSCAVGTVGVGVDRQGGMRTRCVIRRATIHQSSAPPVLSFKCFPPKSPHPHPRFFIAVRTRSPITRTCPARPPTSSPPGSLYVDRPSMQPRPHFTHPLRVQFHHLNIFSPVPLLGRALLPFPTSPAPLTCGVPRSIHLRCTCLRWIRWRFGILSFFDYDYELQYFRLCIILYQVN
jgi:hypothetical protein